MAHVIGYQRVRSGRFSKYAALLAALAGALTACHQPEAPKPVQKTFASPDDAGAAFYQAAKAVDIPALLAIFGPDSQNVLLSGDAVKDKDTLMGFVGSYDAMHRWRDIKAGGKFLYVGADNYAFPFRSARTPPASGISIPPRVRMKFSRAASAKTNSPRLPPASPSPMRRTNTSARFAMATPSNNTRRNLSVMTASKTACTGRPPRVNPKAPLNRFAILPKLPAIPTQEISRSPSMATSTGSSLSRVLAPKASRRTTSSMAS